MTETHSQWLLTGGFPPEPDAGSWDEIASMPGPLSLLEAIFLAYANVSVNDMPKREDETAAALEGDWQTRACTWQKDGAGYRLTERKCIETTAIQPDILLETFGLSGLQIHWRYSLAHSGQLGHVAFRHGQLTARFDGPEIKSGFETIWTRVYDTAPVFEGS